MSFIGDIKKEIVDEQEKSAHQQAIKSATQIVDAIKEEIKNVLSQNPNATKIAGYLHSDGDSPFLYVSPDEGHLTKSMFDEKRIRPLVERELGKCGFSSFQIVFKTYKEVYKSGESWFGKAKYTERIPELGVAIYVVINW